jgi:3-phenylpropionate/cinnamic acid dioxygenase small subunit
LPSGTEPANAGTFRPVAETDDVLAITALVHRYAELLDAGDLDGVAALFERSAWVAGTRDFRVEGTEAVRHMYDGVILYEDGTPRTKHVITNLVIELAPDRTTATARSYFTVLQATEGLALQPIIAGRYHDAFACDGGTWRFAERIIHPDLQGDLSRHMRGPTR